MLIFLKEKAIKASIIYDLKECEIKGNYFKDITYSELSTQRTFKTSNKLHNILKLDNLYLENGKYSTSFSLNSLKLYTSDEVKIKGSKDFHLNYIIEIDHPYQKKCLIKASHVFDGLEFYKSLRNLDI